MVCGYGDIKENIASYMCRDIEMQSGKDIQYNTRRYSKSTVRTKKAQCREILYLLLKRL